METTQAAQVQRGRSPTSCDQHKNEVKRGFASLANVLHTKNLIPNQVIHQNTICDSDAVDRHRGAAYRLESEPDRLLNTNGDRQTLFRKARPVGVDTENIPKNRCEPKVHILNGFRPDGIARRRCDPGGGCMQGEPSGSARMGQ